MTGPIPTSLSLHRFVCSGLSVPPWLNQSLISKSRTYVRCTSPPITVARRRRGGGGDIICFSGSEDAADAGVEQRPHAQEQPAMIES